MSLHDGFTHHCAMLEQSQSQQSCLYGASSELPYDELRDITGALRPRWSRYFEYLDSVGTAEARANWSKAKQLLQENGASYRFYRGSDSGERPWRLSPVPVLLGSEDWPALSSGIAQRARLLSCLLADLYGPQRTLVEGDLPSELVFDNPRFLRPIHGLLQKKNNWLPLYAVDLIRAPNGRFYALEDSTQSPSGMGYALENRIVVAQALSAHLRHCNVERLVGYFRLMRERMQDLAPHNRDTPRIALLTPGPLSATYFEQAYLAQYLGLSLVQGEDLAVRGDRVFLKTLGGLQPIDVLLRRVFDDFCDPLELRSDSALGVPGLVQSIRSGNIGIMNPIGTGLLETPALAAYLPRLCQKLLQEELSLPSVPTYYCGDPVQLPQVLDDFESMVIKSAKSPERIDSTFVHQLEPSARRALAQRIVNAPHDYVAQRFVPSSRTPVFAAGQLKSRAYVLRCFAHCGQPSDYHVMPGGLALVAPADTDLAVSLKHGARSKDVWVVATDSLDDTSRSLSVNSPLKISRGGGDLQSRIADNLYWLGRYTERAEGVGRLARVVGARLLEFRNERDLERSIEMARLRSALLMQTQFLSAAELPSQSVLSLATYEGDLLEAISSDSCGGSVVTSLRSALRVSRVVRDRLSYDTWRILSSLDDTVTRLHLGDERGQVARLTNDLNQVVISLAGFSGLAMESMTRGFAWRFLDMGRRLERAISLVNLLRAAFETADERETPLAEAVLDVADSGMTYRRRYPTSLQVAPVVDLLLADDTNPRSVLFQLRTMSEHIAALPPLSTAGLRTTQHRLLLSATSQIELSDIGELCQLNPASQRRSGLVSLLDQLAKTFPGLSDSLTETYLYHANVARHLNHRGAESAEPAHWESST